MSAVCKYPARCGSDGRFCCHHECDFSLHEQTKREHYRLLAKTKRIRAAAEVPHAR